MTIENFWLVSLSRSSSDRPTLPRTQKFANQHSLSVHFGISLTRSSCILFRGVKAMTHPLTPHCLQIHYSSRAC